MAVYGLARRCLQGGLLHFVRKDSAGHCEERSDVAVHRDRLSDRAQCLLVCCNYA